MATTGAKYPTLGAAASEAPWSDDTWVSPTAIYSDNALSSYINASTFDNGDQSLVLKATGFDFSSVPDNAIIRGVIVRVNTWYANGTVSMDLCQLLDTSKAKVGTNNCSTPVILGNSDAGIVTLGGASDLWGNALTPAWIKNANFGVAIGMLSTGADSDVMVDYVTLEVIYSVPPALPSKRFRRIIGRR